MELFRNMLERAINYMSTIGVSDILDILIVALLIYRVIILVRRTNTYNLARGLIVFLVALWISGIFRLST